MPIATFLETARDRILDEAVSFALTIPALTGTGEKALRDHLPELLRAISADLRSSQSRADSITKSHGQAPEAEAQSAAQTHGLMRAQNGISIEQLVAEFRALRSSVLRLWAEDEPPGPRAIADVIRFNEAIDQAVAESVQFYADERERWRQIFLSVLGHDLRGPLNAVSLTVQMMRQQAIASPAHTALLARGVSRMSSLLDSLLEYSRASLGVGMDLHRAHADLATACAEELELQRAAHPGVDIELTATGPTDGVFDASRVREALSNLVSNAINHGDPDTPVAVTLVGDAACVRISVENAGELVDHEIERLFEPLRQRDSPTARARGTHLGLGLFIARQIARAHGGEISGRCTAGRVCFSFDLPKNTT